MAKLISAPTVIPAAGQPPKIIEEFFGRVNSQTSVISIAKMTSPAGWSEPRQTPEFDESTEGAEYIAVCLPAFSPQTVHRDQ
jgi:hypothetical protein